MISVRCWFILVTVLSPLHLTLTVSASDNETPNKIKDDFQSVKEQHRSVRDVSDFIKDDNALDDEVPVIYEKFNYYPFVRSLRAFSPKRIPQNIVHFGKRTDPDDEVDNGEEEANQNDLQDEYRYNVEIESRSPHGMLHFGKRLSPNSVVHFGKRSPSPHAIVHFGKRTSPNSVVHFGKRTAENMANYPKRPASNMLNFGRRAGHSSMVYFGKRRSPSELMHFGKRFSPSQVVHFGKRMQSQVVHFGKRPAANQMMNFGKKRIPGNIVHFGKRSLNERDGGLGQKQTIGDESTRDKSEGEVDVVKRSIDSYPNRIHDLSWRVPFLGDNAVKHHLTKEDIDSLYDVIYESLLDEQNQGEDSVDESKRSSPSRRTVELYDRQAKNSVLHFG